MQNDNVEPVSDVLSEYDTFYAESIENPREFWSRMAAKTLIWEKPFTKEKVMSQCNIAIGKIHWFDGKLNASGKEPFYLWTNDSSYVNILFA